jgi:hypothetical protein
MRNYVRKTNRASRPKDMIIEAIKEILKDGNSFYAVSKKYNIPRPSLKRYCEQYCNMLKTSGKNLSDLSKELDISIGNEKRNRRVFNSDDEDKLERYLLKCSCINFGLSRKEVRKLAY